MAKGITESDVHGAADALVAAGERPTVERIRAHLGTGSPNTVIRWLDTWWQGLGARLTAQQARAALPGAPHEVAALATQLWEQTLGHARQLVETELQSDRDALAASHAELARQVSAWEEQIREHAQIASEADARLAATEMRLTDLQRLVEQKAAQLSDLQQQRSTLQQRSEQAESRASELAARLDTTNATAADERDRLLQQLRGIEERTAQEIDRARQETKRVHTQWDAREREWRTAEASWQSRLEQAGRDTVAAQREVAAQQARTQALEHQLAHLGDIAASVEAALARAKPTRAPRAQAATVSTKARARKPG